jgi:regulator of replication initiation timing
MMKEKIIKILMELEEKLGELELRALNCKAVAREKIEENINLYAEIYKELKSREKKEMARVLLRKRASRFRQRTLRINNKTIRKK